MNIPFISGEVFEGHYPINLFYKKEGWNGRPALIGTPGLKVWCDTEEDTEVRGMCRFSSSYMYAVVGDKVFRVDTIGNKTECTGTLNTSSGVVQMEGGTDYVMIIDSADGYYVSGTTVTDITDTDFPTPSGLTYQDGYFIVSSKNTDRFYLSALDDPSSWNALDYASAEGHSDDIVRAVNNNRELYLIGELTTESWYNSGNADFPFSRNQSVFLGGGCVSGDSVRVIDNSTYLLADDLKVKAIEGYKFRRVSSAALDTLIRGYGDCSDAFGFSYDDDGGTFYVLTFPTGDKTWVFNLETGFWHQWSSGLNGRRHKSNCFVRFADKNLVGDYENGKIYELDSSKYTDDGDTIKRTRTAPPLFDPTTRRRITYHTVEFEFKAGVGLATGQGNDPEIMLEYSDDGARTWSNEKWTGIGKIGKYEDRAVYRRLGSARNRIFRVSMTDPVEWTVVGAYANVTGGIS